MKNWIYFCRTCIKEYTDKLHLLYLGVGRKKVDAEKLALICRAATSSFAYYEEKKDMDHKTAYEVVSFFLQGRKKYFGRSPDAENYGNNDIQEFRDLVEKYGLKGNVVIEYNTSDANALDTIRTITVKNLLVRGCFSAEFNDLQNMNLSNNVFLNTVSVRVIGAEDCLGMVVRENYFKNGASFKVFGITLIEFHQNEFTDGDWQNAAGLSPFSDESGGGLKIEFAPPCLDLLNSQHLSLEWVNGYFSESPSLFIEMIVEFSGNVMSNLFIEERFRKCAVGKEPFDMIHFRGKNRIFSLIMDTRHSVVNLRGNLSEGEGKPRADVDKVFFDTSDKIGMIPEGLGLIFMEKQSKGNFFGRMYALIDRESYISYGKFFTNLQEQSAKKCNRVLENIYARKVRSYNRAFISSKEDKFIFWWGDVVSNGGTSWIKPLFWLLFVQTFFAATAWFVPFVEVTCSSFAILWWEFLDPLSGLPSIKSSGWWANCLSLLHKLVAALMLYESIKAMRRFS